VRTMKEKIKAVFNIKFIGILLNISGKSYCGRSLLNWHTVTYRCRQDQLDWNTNHEWKDKTEKELLGG
jgi:hypothetical protein